MPINGFSTGKDITLVIVTAVGVLQLNGVTGFQANQKTQGLDHKGLDGHIGMGPSRLAGTARSILTGPTARQTIILRSTKPLTTTARTLAPPPSPRRSPKATAASRSIALPVQP